jgi:hypothetical protein
MSRSSRRRCAVIDKELGQSQRSITSCLKGAVRIMKKLMFVLLAVTLLATFAAAQTYTGTANGGAVAIQAIVPQYIGFTSQSVTNIQFDFSSSANTRGAVGIAQGYTDVEVNATASQLPTWTLTYNLSGKPTVTVCAYATDLFGATALSGTVPAKGLLGTSVANHVTSQFGAASAVGTCTQPNAFMLDTITKATHSIGYGTTEGFSYFGLIIPAYATPGTYNGTMNVVAQVI